jgi:uncharacterized protein (TIGR04255 family)
MYEDIHYEKHYLTEVIARIDFLNLLENIETKLPKELHTAALEHFPIAEPQKIVHRSIQASQDDLVTRRSSFIQWNFHGKNREKTLAIERGAIFVVYRSYDSYETLRDEFLGFASSFFDVYEDAQVRRLGLRYINNIEIREEDPFSWDDYLNQYMLQILRFYPSATAIARAFHVLEFNFGEFSLKYQFGMHNPDYPAPIKRKVFVLDLDAYHEGLLEPHDIDDSLDSFHFRIQELFELSITESLRGIMNA